MKEQTEKTFAQPLEPRDKSKPITIDDIYAMQSELRGYARMVARREYKYAVDSCSLMTGALKRLFVPSKSSNRLPETMTYKNRAFFFGCFAKAIRWTLLDIIRREQRYYTMHEVPEDLDLDRIASQYGKYPALVLQLSELSEQLAKIDPKLSDVLELRFWAGFTREETADILDRSIDQVRGLEKKAKDWIRSKWKKDTLA